MRKFEVILRRKSAPDPAAAAPSQSASPGAGKTAAPPDKSGGGEEKGGGLAGIGVALTGLVATIGALTLTGTMGRVQRDNPEAIIAALILVVAAGGAWTIAVTVDSVGYKKWGLGLKTAATVLGVGGFIVALCIAVSTANHQPRPQISAELSGDHKTLTSTVTASNLSSTRRLAFRINLNRADKTAQPLYRSYVGPTSDGDVKQTIVTPLPESLALPPDRSPGLLGHDDAVLQGIRKGHRRRVDRLGNRLHPDHAAAGTEVEGPPGHWLVAVAEPAATERRPSERGCRGFRAAARCGARRRRGRGGRALARR